MNTFALFSLLLPLVAPLPDPAATPFVDLLGAWDHNRRECAEHALRCLGERAEGNLAWATTHHPDLDVRRRAERLLTELDWHEGPTPWIEFADPSERGSWIDLYVNRARNCSAEAIWSGLAPDYPEYRLATVLLLQDLRRLGVPEVHRRAMLAFMAFRETEWKANYLRPAVPD